MRSLTGTLRVYGTNLQADERKALGLSPKQLAFRQWDSISSQAKNAGVRVGDIILGVNDLVLEMDVNGFRRYLEGHFLAGDRVKLNIIRDGKRLDFEVRLGH
jgi:S1-C subfamily serine protease